MSKHIALLSFLLLQLLISEAAATQTALQSDATTLDPDEASLSKNTTTKKTSDSADNKPKKSSQQTNNSNPVLVPSNLGDGTCDPPCVNGGVCSFSLCYCSNYTTGTQCQMKIDDAARFNAAAYIAICLSTFLLGILSAFCCRIVHDQHQDTYEQDEVPLMKKYRDVIKFGSIPSAAVKFNARQ